MKRQTEGGELPLETVFHVAEGIDAEALATLKLLCRQWGVPKAVLALLCWFRRGATSITRAATCGPRPAASRDRAGVRRAAIGRAGPAQRHDRSATALGDAGFHQRPCMGRARPSPTGVLSGMPPRSKWWPALATGQAGFGFVLDLVRNRQPGSVRLSEAIGEGGAEEAAREGAEPTPGPSCFLGPVPRNSQPTLPAACAAIGQKTPLAGRQTIPR